MSACYIAAMRRPADDQAEMYRTRARAYHALVSAEDCDGHLAPALAARLDRCARIVEVGAGTGRVTALLPPGAQVIATEREAAMIAVARESVRRSDVAFLRADARALPLADGSADALVAGWVFGHLRMWMPDGWRDEVERALAEARRVVRAGGTIVIVETLGTGTTEAAPPNESLAEYYALLEERHGFVRHAIETDYAFDSPEHAEEILGPFFGEKTIAKIRANRWSRVPERTGIWTARR